MCPSLHPICCAQRTHITKGCASDSPILDNSIPPQNTITPSKSHSKHTGLVRTDSPIDLRGDLLVHGLWKHGRYGIIDVRVTDTDPSIYKKQSSEKVLIAQENEKKKKYIGVCLNNQRDFTPFVVSVDGLLGPESKGLLRRISSNLSSKWDQNSTLKSEASSTHVLVLSQ